MYVHIAHVFGLCYHRIYQKKHEESQMKERIRNETLIFCAPHYSVIIVLQRKLQIKSDTITYICVD